MNVISNILIACCVLFHFTMLALGILRINLPGSLPWSLQRDYGRLTGAGGSFGFFSPNVPREIDVDFSVDYGGRTQIVTLQEKIDSEVRARVSNMVRLLAKSFKDEKVLRSVAASLTAEVFREYPGALSVTLNAYVYDFPTMGKYREGTRVKLVKVYSARFEKSPLERSPQKLAGGNHEIK